jgi:hypothetical protein
MSRENAKKTLLGLRNNKGFRIKLEEHELNGSGINFKKLGKQAKNALQSTANDVRQAVEPILRDRANLAISQLSGSGFNLKSLKNKAKDAMQSTVQEMAPMLKAKASQVLNEHLSQLSGSGFNFKNLKNKAKDVMQSTVQEMAPMLQERANQVLNEHLSQLSGSGFNLKSLKNKAKEAMQSTVQEMAPMLRERANQALNENLLSPQMQNSLQQMGIKNMVGQGVFGKRVDNFLKKKGIKNEVYSIGSAFKPLVHQAINAVGAAGQAYGIPTGAATAFANRYIDHPDETQAAVRAMVGNGIHKPRLIMRSDSSNIINSENANFYPPPLPTFKQRQMGQSGGSFRN